MFSDGELSTRSPRRRSSARESLVDRLDFRSRPASSFHEALLRILPRQRLKSSPRLCSSAPNSQDKHLCHRECLCGNRARGSESCRVAHVEHDRKPITKYVPPPINKYVPPPVEVQEMQLKSKGRGPSFKSLPLYYEVRLAELLNTVGERQRLSTTKDGPDPFRVNVCWQVLCELCAMDMPLARVLTHIRNEVKGAIYSSYAKPQAGSVAFEQVPYFEMVNRLEDKTKEMLAEDESCREALLARQADIVRIEQTMQELRDEVKHTEATSNDLQYKLDDTKKSLKDAKQQVRTMQEKSRFLWKDLSKAAIKVKRARENEILREGEKAKHAQLQAQYTVLQLELQNTQERLDVARAGAADSVPSNVYEETKLKMKELEGKLAEVQEEIDDVAAHVSQLTPRPKLEISSRRCLGYTASTAEKVVEICRENNLISEELSALELQWTAINTALSELERMIGKLPDEEEKKEAAKGKQKGKKQKDKGEKGKESPGGKKEKKKQNKKGKK